MRLMMLFRGFVERWPRCNVFYNSIRGRFSGPSYRFRGSHRAILVLRL